MRELAAAALVAWLIVGCSGGEPGETVTSQASQPSDSTTTAPSTAPTQDTVAVVAEPTTPLFYGERGEQWNRAWAEVDVDTLGGFFADSAVVNGMLFDTAMAEASARHPDPIGWRQVSEDCIHRSDRYVTCDLVWTSAVHDPAGLVIPVHRQVYFDDEGLITVYRDAVRLDAVIAFEYAIAEWLADEHPDIPPVNWDTDEYEVYADSVQGVLGVVEEFVAWSDDYPPAGPVVEDPVLSGSVEGVEVYNATPEQLELVEWAFDRFRRADLPMPPVTAITFPPTVACASGTSGRAFHNGQEGTIDVCTDAVSFIGDEMPITGRRAILHELGHIWVVGHTTEEVREQFMLQRGVPDWTGVAWEDNGFEHAAEVLMWALIDESAIPRVPNGGSIDLEAAYTILTGLAPPTPSGS